MMDIILMGGEDEDIIVNGPTLILGLRLVWRPLWRLGADTLTVLWLQHCSTAAPGDGSLQHYFCADWLGAGWEQHSALRCWFEMCECWARLYSGAARHQTSLNTTGEHAAAAGNAVTHHGHGASPAAPCSPLQPPAAPCRPRTRCVVRAAARRMLTGGKWF